MEKENHIGRGRSKRKEGKERRGREYTEVEKEVRNEGYKVGKGEKKMRR